MSTRRLDPKTEERLNAQVERDIQQRLAGAGPARTPDPGATPTVDIHAALASTLDNAQARLRVEMEDAGMAYDVARVGAEFARTADAWKRALRVYHAVPPFNAKERAALAEFFAGETARLVDQLIGDAEEARRREQAYANSRLIEWARYNRRPTGRITDATVEHLYGPDAPGGDGLAAVRVTGEVDAEGRTVRVFEYPRPRTSAEGD